MVSFITMLVDIYRPDFSLLLENFLLSEAKLEHVIILADLNFNLNLMGIWYENVHADL